MNSLGRHSINNHDIDSEREVNEGEDEEEKKVVVAGQGRRGEERDELNGNGCEKRRREGRGL